MISGSQDLGLQITINYVNYLLGNYGATLDLVRHSRQRQGNDTQLTGLLGELQSGSVAEMFLLGVNPVADQLAQVVSPEAHFLESWGDAEPVSGVVSLLQPLLPVVGQPRPPVETLADWSGHPEIAYELLRRLPERVPFLLSGSWGF